MLRTFKLDQLTWNDWIAWMVCCIPIFYLLGTPAIYIWDEAVYANASWEMSQGSSWWVPVQGQYNTKPPLVLWLQAISLLVFPSPEWGIRFPSALAAAGILLMMTIALKRWGFSFWARVLVLVCFVGHEGFLRHHISRTGDLDAVMTFFVTAYCLVVLDAIQQKRWTRWHELFFFLSVIAAFYSKSIAGWMMLAPLGLVWILSPMFQVLKTKRFWMLSFLSLFLCLFYYVSREWIQPGYLKLVWHSEYQRVMYNVMPWHEHGFGYYFKNFVRLKTFTPWIYIVGAACVYALIYKKEDGVRSHWLRWMIIAFGYMLLISYPPVKLEWYDAPAYPFFAMILGTVLYSALSSIPEKWKYLWLIPIAFVLWRKISFIRQDINPRHPFELEGAMLRQTNVTPSTKVWMEVEMPEHQLQLDFYRKTKWKETGIEVPVITSTRDISPGDKILVSQSKGFEEIQQGFETEKIIDWKGLGKEVWVGNRKPFSQ